MEQNLLASWLVVDRNEEASHFPQVGLNSAQRSFQEVYWRCVACFYASSYRLNKNVRHVFFTNVETLPVVDGLDLTKFLSRMGVETRCVPITHRLGRDKVLRWNNQFYILDIILDLVQDGSFENALVLDSDCVWVRPATDFFADIARRGILSLSIAYSKDQKINGASREDLGRAARQLADHTFDFVPHYSGGELLAVNRRRLRDISNLADRMWARLVASPPGQVDVYEEAQFLSIIYEILDVPVGTADPHTRRMWNALRLNNVSAEDVDSSRSVWHLPMEKKTGFKDLFLLVQNEDSWFWSVAPEELRLRIAGVMGIPKRTLRQWALQAQSRLSFYAFEQLASKRYSLLKKK